MTVDIICSILDGERFLPDLLRSLQEQTHADWRLWVRDDGSTDRTVDIVRANAATDARINLLHVGGPRLGVAGGFGWLLERLPGDSTYAMCADADDVWLPRKIERTLAAMLEAERDSSERTPTLVHTDLTVVDENLVVRHPSFWAFTGIDPEPATLRRIVVRNVATAPTVMMNRALRELVGATPPDAIFQDWWYALVASAFGRVVALHESTVLYRQHGANAVGARPVAGETWRDIPDTIMKRVNTASLFRRALARTAKQARAFADRFGDRLTHEDRRFLEAYARIPQRSFLRRKVDLLRFRRLPEQGLLSTLGILLRG